MRKTSASPLLLLALCLFLPSLSAVAQEGPYNCSISWDQNGIPYIQAETDGDALFGQGYAMAECSLLALKLIYAESLGYSSLYVKGPPADPYFYLEPDFLAKKLRIPMLVDMVYDHMASQPPGSPEAVVLDLISHFANGINYYIQENPTRINLIASNMYHPRYYPNEYQRTRAFLNLSITAEDVIGVFLSNRIRKLWYSQVKALKASYGRSSPRDEPPPNSNAWAVNENVSATGYPWLYIDPHLDIQSDPNLWLIACGIDGENIRARGLTFLGLPFITMGVKLERDGVTGDRIMGWTYTSCPVDQADLFKVKLVDEDSYEFDSDGDEVMETTDFLEISTTVDYFDWENYTTAVTAPRVYRYTDNDPDHATYPDNHGPVIDEYDFQDPYLKYLINNDDYAYAARMAMSIHSSVLPDMNTHLYRMLTSTDLADLEVVLDDMSFAGGNHMVIATNDPDVDNQIAYVQYGPVPVRNQSQGPTYDYSGVVDGSSLDTLWEKTDDLDDLHILNDLPRSPATGGQDYYIACNGTADQAVEDLDLTDFDRYIVGYHDSQITWRQEYAHHLLVDEVIDQDGDVDLQLMEDMAIDKYSLQAEYAYYVLAEAYTAHYAEHGDEYPEHIEHIIFDRLLPWPEDLKKCRVIAPLYMLWMYNFQKEYDTFVRVNLVHAMEWPEAERAFQLLNAVFEEIKVNDSYQDELQVPWGSINNLYRMAPNGVLRKWSVSGGSCLRSNSGKLSEIRMDPYFPLRVFEGGGQQASGPGKKLNPDTPAARTGAGHGAGIPWLLETFELQYGQVCSAIVEFGEGNDDTHIHYIKAIDNFNDPMMPHYSTQCTQTWADIEKSRFSELYIADSDIDENACFVDTLVDVYVDP